MQIDDFDDGDDGLDVGPIEAARPIASDADRAARLYPDEAEDGEGADELEGRAKDESDADGLPAKYEVTPIEGMSVDKALLDEATPVFRELKLSNESVNRLMPLAKKVADRTIGSLEADHTKAKQLWAKQSKATYGATPQQWKETKHLINQALDAAGVKQGSSFIQLLDKTGLGNHPEMIRVFRVLGSQVGAARGERIRRRMSPGRIGREETRYPDD